MDGLDGWIGWMDGWIEICYMLKDSPGIPNYPGIVVHVYMDGWMDEWIQLGQKMVDG